MKMWIHHGLTVGVSLPWLFLLPVIAAMAGFMDALAGGGGLITIPALLLAGLDPITAMATSKFQGIFGTAAASFKFARAGMINFRQVSPMLVFACIGAVTGATLVQHINTHQLMLAMPVVLILIAIYLLLAKNFGAASQQPKISDDLFCLTVPFVIGVWDGMMGPATGSFFALAFTILLGQSLLQATAHAKILNFTTNISAMMIFAISGHILWLIGGLMTVGVLVGGWLGAHMAIKRGTYLIRWVLVIVSFAMSTKLIYQYW